MSYDLKLTALVEPTHFWFQGFRAYVMPVIREIVEGRRDLRMIDCGCGTGYNLRPLLQPYGQACTFDMSPDALQRARASGLPLACADMEHIPFHSGSFDLVTSFDVVHSVTDDRKALREMARVLKPGGVFAFNTSFYEGSHPPESEQFYRRWLMRALRILRSKYGLSPQKSEKVESRRHLSPEEYTQLLEGIGFNVKKRRIQTVQVPLEGWVTISQFEDWIKGVMPGVPLKEASDSLTDAAAEVFDDLKVNFIPRNWLHIIAARP